MTKPHSDTPRTDAVVRPGEYGQDYEIVDAEFARKLEREGDEWKRLLLAMLVTLECGEEDQRIRAEIEKLSGQA